MKHSLAYIVLALSALSAIKLVFIVFQDTVGGWQLAAFSLVIGVFFSAVLWFILDHIHFLMAGFIGVFSAVALIQVLNHKLASTEFETQIFTVSQIGKSYVRYNSFNYLEVTNKQGLTITIPNELELLLRKGDNINVFIVKGFWGLPIVKSISKTKI